MRSGFTLIELAIVLVILGLLAGGIMEGQSLIRQAELRRTITEIQKMRTVLATFRDKYFALPGDMTNATAFWGSLGGTGSDATCQNLTATGTATCNGNGDGKITMSVVSNDERYRAWQHLANAGLIEGSYTGVAGPGGAADMIPGTNMAPSAASSSAYEAFYGYPGRHVSDTATAFAGNYGLVGEVRATDSSGNFLPVFKPEEMWNIDKKLDDGRPAYGFIIAYKNQGSIDQCVTSSTSSTAEYSLSVTSLECTLIATNLI